MQGRLCSVRPEAEPSGDDHSRHKRANGALRGPAHFVEGVHGDLLTLSLLIRVIAVFVSSDAILLRKVAVDETLPASCGGLPAKGIPRRRMAAMTQRHPQVLREIQRKKPTFRTQ
jgi:hypothetical protein